MSAVALDHGRIAAADSAVAISGSPRPPVARNNALMDAIFRNVIRFFAFLVFSLLAAILVSLPIGARQSLDRFALAFLWNGDSQPLPQHFAPPFPLPAPPSPSPIP